MAGVGRGRFHAAGVPTAVEPNPHTNKIKSLTRGYGIKPIEFLAADALAYTDTLRPHLRPQDVVYADPPYFGTRGDYFDMSLTADAFWRWATGLSSVCHVYVSMYDYHAPKGWVSVWQNVTHNKASNNYEASRGQIRRECVFALEGSHAHKTQVDSQLFFYGGGLR